jgi:2-oxoglutarate ferredoxin oxidoreductase subunit alpha
VHGGHGEFVRVVLSPVDVADAFHVTSEAFRLAERFRCPAFVALDQQASLFKQAVPPFDLAGEARRHLPRTANLAPAGSNAWEASYSAYGDTGADPVRVALPGESGGRYYSNSTEHAPNGFTTEDPKTRVKMVERRLERMRAIVAETKDPLVVEGAAANDADVILVSWGSTVDACREASNRLLRKGVRARVVGVRLLWPFPREAFQQAVAGAAPIHVVEANAFAQLARLIRSELPLHARMRSVLQYDGRTIASDAILAAVQA